MAIRMKSCRFIVVLLAVLAASLLVQASPTLPLTDEEQAWIAAHPVVRVANEMDWPPFDFMEGGEPRGYSIDLVRLALDKVGLKVEFVNGLTWTEIIDAFRAGDIDILPAIYITEERKEIMTFTRGYVSNIAVLVVRAEDHDSVSVKNLEGSRVAVIPGYAITGALEARYPDLERILVSDVKDGLEAVVNGEADAFVESRGVVAHSIEVNEIDGLRIAGDAGVLKASESVLYMATLKEKSLLRRVLQHGLDRVTREEIQAVRTRWLVPVTVDRDSDEEEERARKWLWMVAVGLAIILIVYLIIRVAFSFN